MIDAALLKKLGWSDQLIGEVTRGAPALRDAANRLGDAPAVATVTSVASSSLHYQEGSDHSSRELYVPPQPTAGG